MAKRKKNDKILIVYTSSPGNTERMAKLGNSFSLSNLIVDAVK